MANYQPPHNFVPHHPGENNPGAQSAGASHPAQGMMDDTAALHRPAQIPASNEDDNATDGSQGTCHARINFNSTHTCAACMATFRNNYALEQHASKERHQAFLCTCGTDFGRLGSLDRHITAQAGPKYHCTYCDSNKSFAREDKLIDHLRASHKFGEKAIAQFRSQARAQPKRDGHAPPMVATTTPALPDSTLAGYDAALGGIAGQAGYFDGPSIDPVGALDDGLPFGSVEDYPIFDVADDFMDFDFSGIDFDGFDFTGVDGDLDMSGMDLNI